LANLGTALIPHLVFGFREWSIIPDKIAHQRLELKSSS
jgi:hypothetical protein